MDEQKKRSPANGGRDYLLPVLIFLPAFFVRLIYVLQSADNPTFRVPIIDSATYSDMASAVSSGAVDPRIFWQSFFYPLYLAAVFGLTDGSLAAARMIQIIAGSITCVLVYVLGKEIFDRRTAATAGLIAAFYGPGMFFDAEILPTVWETFWGTVLLILLLKAAKAEGVLVYLVAGMAGGLSVLAKATFIPFFIIASIWTVREALRRRMGSGAAALRIFLLYAGFAAVLSVDAVMCARTTGNFSAVPKSGTLNLYLGNNAMRDSTMMIRPGVGWRQLIREPEVHGARSDSEYRKYFMDRFREYIVMHPGGYIKGLAAKTAEFLSSRELPRNIDIYSFRQYSHILGALVWKQGEFGFPFGFLLGFFALGAFMSRKRIPPLLWIFLVVYPVSIIAVFVSSRYRAVMIPAVAIVASSGIWSLASDISRKRWKRCAAAAAAAIAVMALSSVGGPFATERFDYEAEMHASVGYEMAKKGDLAGAEAELLKAIDLNQGYGAGHRILGNILSQQGKYREAADHFRKALGADPHSYPTRFYLGLALIKLGEGEEAMEHLAAALEGARGAKEEEMCRRIESLMRTIDPSSGP